MTKADPAPSSERAPAVEACPLCVLQVRFPHALRAALLLCLALLVAAVANAANPLGIRWTLSPGGRVGIPRTYEARLPEASAKEARAMFDAGTAIFIDTRDARDYQKDHIPGAVNLPMRDWQRAWSKVSASGELPKEARLLIYCYGRKCGLSTRAGKRLLEEGYRHPIILEYGWTEWNDAGYPTVEHPQGRGR